ncbi:MAG TPA: hypothetical protein VJZ76_12935 [Thermoanaerobaculia bacterium]|nr:hypothetical protein [Thermoanaerobaculia bacterium]
MTLEMHVSIEDLLRFRDGGLPAEEVVPLSRHLATCAACAALAQEMFAGDIERLGRALGERELARSRRMTRIVFAAAAAAILIVIALAVVLRPSKSIPPVAHRPPPRSTTPSRWDAVKTEALRAGFIAAPAVVDSVRILPSEQVRGLDSDEPATALQPNGVVLDDARPRFRWHVKGGTTATVSVFADGNLVIRSPAVRGSEWTPERDLPRGAVYQWQLEVKTRKKTYTVPAAPARPPSFAIVDEESHRRLADARREAPGDHLLLGILAAHAGLQAEAVEELDRYSAAHPGDAAARALEASVRHWTVR